MLKKKIKYTDYFGVEREETFYFNLTESELRDMNLEANGNLEQELTIAVEAKDIAKMGRIFKELILKAYGEISSDGRRFVKNGGALSREFEETPAFDALYTELFDTEGSAVDFFKAVLPDTNKKQ